MSCPRFVLGLDLGQAVDPSALAVLDTSDGMLDVRFLDRWKPERPNLTCVIHRLVDLLEEKPQLLDGALAFDAAGIGRAFEPRLLGSAVAKMIPIYSVVAVAGWRPAGQKRGVIFVPKAALVDTFTRALEAGKLRIADLPLAAVLRHEMTVYQERELPDGRRAWGAKRGEHDDVLSAVQMAVWLATRLQSQGRSGFVPANRYQEVPCLTPA